VGHQKTAAGGRERRLAAPRGQSMEISDWRHKIDELDEQIVRLINERAQAARAIGELKQKANLPVYEPQREKDVFEHIRKSNPGPLSDLEIVEIYERIIDVMRGLQKHS
jgi:chorismate mutase